MPDGGLAGGGGIRAGGVEQPFSDITTNGLGTNVRVSGGDEHSRAHRVGVEVPAEAGKDAARDGVRVFSQGVPDRDGRLPDPYVVRRRERHGRQAVRIDLEQGQVIDGVDVDDIRLEGAPIRQEDRVRRRPVSCHVAIRHDHAARIDQETGPATDLGEAVRR